MTGDNVPFSMMPIAAVVAVMVPLWMTEESEAIWVYTVLSHIREEIHVVKETSTIVRRPVYICRDGIDRP